MAIYSIYGHVLRAVDAEISRAAQSYPSFHSQHEGYAVLKEESDELWDRIKASKGLKSDGVTAVEAVQVAAMAVRFVLDLCDPDEFAAAWDDYEQTR